MNPLQEQIMRCMSPVESVDGKLVSTFCFSSDFIGFQGHFPGSPVLPGVCLIQAVLVILQTSGDRKITLRQVVQAKFFSAVMCGEKCRFECVEQDKGDGEYLVRTFVSREDEKVAKIDILVNARNEVTTQL